MPVKARSLPDRRFIRGRLGPSRWVSMRHYIYPAHLMLLSLISPHFLLSTPRQSHDMNDPREIHAEKAQPNESDAVHDQSMEKPELSHVDEAVDLKAGAHKSVGLAVIGQTHTIPTSGNRKVTTKVEYWTYCIFCRLIFTALAFTDNQTSALMAIVGDSFGGKAIRVDAC